MSLFCTNNPFPFIAYFFAHFFDYIFFCEFEIGLIKDHIQLMS